MNLAINHGLEHRKQGRLLAAIMVVCLLGSFQPASAQNTLPGYGQQQGPYGQPVIPVTNNSQQYQAGLVPSQPLTARTQLDQEFGNSSYQPPLAMVQQPPQTQSTAKRTKKKGHPLLQRLGNAAGQAGSVALRTAGTAARVGMSTGMMYAMYRGTGYGSGYGYNPSYMYSYLPYMGYRMLAPY